MEVVYVLEGPSQAPLSVDEPTAIANYLDRHPGSGCEFDLVYRNSYCRLKRVPQGTGRLTLPLHCSAFRKSNNVKFQEALVKQILSSNVLEVIVPSHFKFCPKVIKL